MSPRLTFRRLNWKWSLPGLILVALLAAFFNPPESGVTSGEFEYVQRVVDGHTLMLGTGERVRLIGVNTPETVHPKKAVEAFGKEASAFTKRMVEGNSIEMEDESVDGFNVGMNSGASAGQTVSHCHIHLIPRRAGDVPDPRGGIRHTIPGKGYYDQV
jgi:hypothetical protein